MINKRSQSSIHYLSRPLTGQNTIAIMKSLFPRFRPFLTTSKTHTDIRNRNLQTIVVTASMEAEEELVALELMKGLQIPNRTVREIWRYKPPMSPKTISLKFEGLLYFM